MKSWGPSRRSLLTLLASLPAIAQNQNPTLPIHALASLKKDHPRILLSDEDLDKLRTAIRESPLARRIYLELAKEADRLLAQPVFEYRNGTRFTVIARHATDRIYTLALLYRLDRKRAWLDRAARELRALAGFRDWNPTRFLDTADITHAMGIGYDWLYGALSPDDRQIVRDAILQKGLDAAMPIFERQLSFAASHLYGNLVCNAGMTIGALAVAEEEDMEKCEAIVRFAVDSLPRALATYTVDGGWPEGETYWNIATRSAAVMLDALETAAATDFGLLGSKRLDRIGRFRLYTTGPTGRVFNFGDAAEDDGSVPEMFWLAKHAGQPQFAWHEARHIERTGRIDPLDLVWYDREQRMPAGPAWPLDIVFPSLGLATFRSSWEDPDALYVAAIAHDNRSPRSHYDLGSFIFEAGGIRWAVDLGPEDAGPALPPSQPGRPHFSPYRTRTEAHNTITIDGQNQDSRAEGRITRHESTPDLAWVQFDLTRAYPGKLKFLQRRIGIGQRQAVLIQDSFRADQPVEAVWGMITEADVSLSGQRAELRKGDWAVSAEIITPRHALFDIESTRALPPQTPNTGTRKLIVRLGEKVTDLELNIVFTPYRQGQAKPKIGVRFPTT